MKLNCLNGSTTSNFIQKEPEQSWTDEGHVVFKHLIKTWNVAHQTMSTHWLKRTMLCLFLSQVNIACYTPFSTTPITHRYSWSTLPNFLFCCLPGSLFILLAIFLSFMLAPSQRARKIVPWEKDNNNLWQCTWVKCPGVMKQLQALTDGPCCKLGAAAVTETANRQMQRHNHIHKLSHSCSYSSTLGCQVTTLI